MRSWPLAFVVSAVVHAAVVPWLATRSPPPRPVEPPAATPIEIVTVDRPIAQPAPVDVALDVALLDEPVVAAVPTRPVPAIVSTRPVPAIVPARPVPAPSSPVEAPARPARPGPALATRTPPGAGPAQLPGPGPAQLPGEPGDHRRDRPSLLAMRHGEAPRAALPFGRWDSLDHAPRGTAPERDRTTGLLHDAGGGSHRSGSGPFEARVNPDGTVALSDNPNLRVHLAVPMPRDIGRAIASWYTSDKGRFGTEGDTAMSRQIQVSPGATVAPSDPTGSQPQDHATTVVVPVLAGGFDVSDWLMRDHGQDPYAARKLALLDATRDERVQIGNRHRAAELARAPEVVHRNLEELWARTADLGARKQGLFELWDDCAETGEPEVVAAGEAARRMIVGFIRAHLPAGSAGAYTADELAALARARHSQAAFAPYE